MHQHDSVVGIRSPLTWTSLPLSPSSHCSRLSQNRGFELPVSANSHWLSISHMVIYMFQWYSPSLSHPVLPLPRPQSVAFVRQAYSLPLSHHWASWEAHGAVSEVLKELDLESWLCPGSQLSTPKSLRLWDTEAAAQLMNLGVKDKSWTLGPRKKARARPKGMSGRPCSVGERCCMTVGAENTATGRSEERRNRSAVRKKRRTMRSNPARGGLRCPAQGGSDSEPAGKCSV